MKVLFDVDSLGFWDWTLSNSLSFIYISCFLLLLFFVFSRNGQRKVIASVACLSFGIMFTAWFFINKQDQYIAVKKCLMTSCFLEKRGVISFYELLPGGRKINMHINDSRFLISNVHEYSARSELNKLKIGDKVEIYLMEERGEYKVIKLSLIVSQ